MTTEPQVSIRVHLQPHNIATNVIVTVRTTSVATIIGKAFTRIQGLIGEACDVNDALVFLASAGKELVPIAKEALLESVLQEDEAREGPAGSTANQTLIVQLPRGRTCNPSPSASPVTIHLMRPDRSWIDYPVLLGGNNPQSPMATVELFPSSKSTVLKVVEKAIREAQNSLGKALISDRIASIRLVGTSQPVDTLETIGRVQEMRVGASLTAASCMADPGAAIQLAVTLDFDHVLERSTGSFSNTAKGWLSSLTRRGRSTTVPSAKVHRKRPSTSHPGWPDGLTASARSAHPPSSSWGPPDAPMSSPGTHEPLMGMPPDLRWNASLRHRRATVDTGTQDQVHRQKISPESKIVRVIVEDHSLMLKIDDRTTVRSLTERVAGRVKSR